MDSITAFLRIRLSAGDAHYGGGLVSGARIMELFGDLATEIAIRHDGDEGLLRAYETIELFAPVYAGDYIEGRAVLTHVGRTSRTMEFEAYKVIAARPDISPTAADVLETPILIMRARSTTVVKAECQRLVSGTPRPVEAGGDEEE
jgi:3-aminobutyryl-CoA ammonia-lyase